MGHGFIVLTRGARDINLYQMKSEAAQTRRNTLRFRLITVAAACICALLSAERPQGACHRARSLALQR